MGFEHDFPPPLDPAMHSNASPHPFMMQPLSYSDPYFTDENTLFYVSPTESTGLQPASAKAMDDDADEDDTASRPRLSPEQLAILEEHFGSHQKPNTDFKKQLAEQMGLSLSRVNNWYQNRRAKQRHQRPQTRRFDVYPDENNSLWFQSLSSYVGAPDYVGTSGALMNPTPLLSSSGWRSPESGTDQPLTEVDQMILSTDEDEVVPASTTFSGQPLPQSCVDIAFPPLPDSPDLDLLDFGSEPEQKHFFEPEAQAPPSLYCLTQPLYSSATPGMPMANFSTHSFTTFDSSPDDQQAHFITPPEKPSPVSFVALDHLHRRPSLTSDLTNNMDHIQLQRQRSNQDVQEPACPTVSDHVTLDSSTFSPEPPKLEVTDERSYPGGSSTGPVTRTSSVPNLDLASRRKRPRPAALRPEANRSHSYNGPMTMSPTSRTPSLLSVDSPSVRRIRSTGQNLNVSTGRISKSTAMAAQLSPRNIQTCAEDAISAKSFAVTPRGGATTGPLTPQTSESFPTSAASMMDPGAGMAYSTHQHPGAGMFIQSPPITPFVRGQNPMEFAMPQAVACQVPPQSAPPKRTTFFQDSPILGPQQSAPGLHGLPTAETLSHGAPGIVMPEHTYYHHRHANSQSPPISQDFGVPYEMQRPLYYGHPHQLPLGMPPPVSTVPYYAAPAPAPPKDLEIQVTTIPQPKGPIQGPRTFTFSNVTPEDFNTPSTGTGNGTAAR